MTQQCGIVMTSAKQFRAGVLVHYTFTENDVKYEIAYQQRDNPRHGISLCF